MISKLLQQSNKAVKGSFELLLKGESISCPIEEQIVYNRLNDSEMAVFSLLLVSGYLKVLEKEDYRLATGGKRPKYVLQLTNHEVRLMFFSMVQEWFENTGSDYNDFLKAFLGGDVKYMNTYMKKVAELSDRYRITSNRESGFGRYDVVIEPFDKEKDAFILEFKVKDSEEESLEAAVKAALRQIEEKQYATDLLARGFKENQIRKYGFAFAGKRVLIG